MFSQHNSDIDAKTPEGTHQKGENVCNTDMNAVAIKLPTFWSTQPQVWFVQPRLNLEFATLYLIARNIIKW